MKKLFTLLMILAVASVGYSQVMKVSKNDFRGKAEQMRTVSRVESQEAMQNVQIEPSITRVDGIEGEQVQLSTYDWQSNDGARTWTKVWDDGKVNFAFTVATDNAFSDRGTGIITYDSNTGEWSTVDGRIENEKTGFGSIAQYGANGLVVAAHTATECHVYIIPDKDNMTGGSVAKVSALDNTNEPTWPSVMTSGPNRDIIHVVATCYTNNLEGDNANINDALIYFRSTDGGQTWDKENVVLPYLSADYTLDLTSNCAYWMETTEDNCLALVINNAWSDGFVLCSYDDGETWEQKMFYKHPGPLNNVNSDSAWYFYPRWTSAQWKSNGKLAMAYSFMATTGDVGSGSYYPTLGGVSFWAEDMYYHSDSMPEYGFDANNPNAPELGKCGFIMDSTYIYYDIYASWPFFSDGTHYYGMLPEYIGYISPLYDDGFWQDPYGDDLTEFNLVSSESRQHGAYNSGICDFPVLCRVPGSDDFVAVWSSLDENHKDGSDKYFYHLFASYSPDGGESWTNMLNLEAGDDYWVYSYSEMVYPQAAIVGDQLIIAVQQDEDAGTYVQSDETDPTNNFYTGYVFDLNELFPGVGVNVPEVSHNTKMTVSPNPATTQLNVSLNHDSDIVIYTITGQVVSTQKGHVGPNTINISSLSSGVYFINAGSDTQKFVVK